MLVNYGVFDLASVPDAPLTNENTTTPWYSLATLPSEVSDIDLLIVDGPPEATASYARYPALPVLASRMAHNGTIILDDTNRHDELEILARWKREFPGYVHRLVECAKGCAILTRSADQA